MSTKPHDGTVGDMMRELIELREALAKANAAIGSNRDPVAPFADDVESLTTRLLPLVMDPVARGVLEDIQQGRSSSVRLARERDEARTALVEITHRYVDAEARAAAVPPELAAMCGQAAREVIVKDTPLEEPPLTDAQIQAAIDKGKADRARLEAAGWQHGLMPKRPPYCHGQCVNAPEGEPPLQRTFNMVCAGCTERMIKEQDSAIDAIARADYERLTRALENKAPSPAPLATGSALSVEDNPQMRAMATAMAGGPVAPGVKHVRYDAQLLQAAFASKVRDARLLQAAIDTEDPAYWRGSADAAASTVRALVGVLDGPIDAKPCFGSPELTKLAARLLAMRAELLAVHGDLGKAVDQVASLESDLVDADQVTQDALGHARAAHAGEIQKTIDALWEAAGVPPTVPHGGKTLDEMVRYVKEAFATNHAALVEVIAAVGELAHASCLEWPDADVPTALATLKTAQIQAGRYADTAADAGATDNKETK